jgi:hypothetical protein
VDRRRRRVVWFRAQRNDVPAFLEIALCRLALVSRRTMRAAIIPSARAAASTGMPAELKLAGFAVRIIDPHQGSARQYCL